MFLRPRAMSFPAAEKRIPLILLTLSLLIGTALRFAWLDDVEFKGDESLMFHWSQTMGRSSPWLPVGMASTSGLPNPGLSVWVFVALARLTGAATPPALSGAVILLNCLALALLAALAFRRIQRPEREAWLWATALASVNPVALQLQRKIWAQSVLPFFCALSLLAWFGRGRRGGAFAWGLLGPCLGQIHQSGFFFAAAVALWTAAFDFRSVRWRWWFLGALAGSLPMLPWLAFVWGMPLRPPLAWAWVLRGQFWRLWLEEPLGYSLSGVLGPLCLPDFLDKPVLFDHPTHLVAAAYTLTATIGALVLAWAIVAPARQLWARKLPRPSSETRRLESSALLGFGALLTLTRRKISRHYLIVAFPLPYVFFARQALRFPLRPRALLAALWIAELFLSASFLSYIHKHGGAPGRDYGISYGEQREAPPPR